VARREQRRHCPDRVVKEDVGHERERLVAETSVGDDGMSVDIEWKAAPGAPQAVYIAIIAAEVPAGATA
jgi:hypothetical protein